MSAFEVSSVAGLSTGPALELEARLAAQKEAEGHQSIEGVKRRKVQVAQVDRANPGVRMRDLKDRATLRVTASLITGFIEAAVLLDLISLRCVYHSCMSYNYTLELLHAGNGGIAASVFDLLQVSRMPSEDIKLLCNVDKHRHEQAGPLTPIGISFLSSPDAHDHESCLICARRAWRSQEASACWSAEANSLRGSGAVCRSARE